MTQSRSFDVVVYGATGFTGQLVCEYLVRQPGLRLALAGRNLGKLEHVREELARAQPNARSLELLVADSADPVALRAMAERTKVVCNTAGPFARYGSEVVAACVDRGTHYCDITGEVQWVRRMIDAHHAQARDKGVRIVCCCGYDSIPSDLGVFVLEEHARRALGAPAREVKSVVSARSPSFSGGTFASMMNAVAEAREDKRVRAILANPYALCPDVSGTANGHHERRGAAYDAELHSFTIPFIMAVPNTRIVHRSNALLGFPYGEGFWYEELAKTGRGVKGALGAAAAAGGIAGFQVALAVGPVREVLRKKVPQPGEGPSAERRKGSFFALDFQGHVGERLVRAKFAANGDPGYGETAKMVGESALCLAFDGDKLTSEGGVLTAASAMGMPLVERLRRAGMRIEAWTA